MLVACCCLLTLFPTVHGYHDPILEQYEKYIPTYTINPPKPYHLTENDELLFTQVVWRHGDRAPVVSYPTDIHKEDVWPNGYGELTELGMRQQYALGKLLYNKYINTSRPLLKSYNPKEVYIQSTDVNRTLVSALANLAGMFGSEDGHPTESFWPSGWTPVPVHTINENEDYVGNVFAPCPRATDLTKQIYNGNAFRKFVAENQGFLNVLSQKTGQKVEMSEVYLINDVHYIEKLYNLSQPDWITEEVEIKLRNLSRVAERFLFGIADPYEPELIKLRGGPLLTTMIDKMNQKLKCISRSRNLGDCNWISKLKYHAYSAHDTTIYAFLTTFGDEEKVIKGGLPHYTASIAVELWNLKQGGPSVRVLYHSGYHSDYQVITHLINGCPSDSEFCSLKTFERRSRPFMVKDMKEECKAHGKKNRGKKWGPKKHFS